MKFSCLRAVAIAALLAAMPATLYAEASPAHPAAQLPMPAGTYKEPYRPAYHFTPPQAWMNDPNGMVYYNGQYHLFYQYHPYSNVWGPMHWGHATSEDMIHWVNKPVALAPDSLGFIFSGSAVVDWNNTSGFGTKDKPPLVAIFTYHNDAYKQSGLNQPQNQGIAYSTDNGETWTKFKDNPVLLAPAGKPDFRDPKVRWNEGSKSWIMTLAVGDHTEFYGSPDLKKWHYLSRFGSGLGAHGGVWECPDLLPIKVAETGETKWLLLQSLNPGGPNGGSATQYFIGDFDGKDFVLDPKFAAQLTQAGPQWIDWGRDNYAGVTWSDVPQSDGRVLMLGWMSNWDYATVVPTTVWRSAMTLPRELTLHVDANGYVLRSLPVAEAGKLEGDTYEVQPQLVSGGLQGSVPVEVVTRSKTDVEFARPTEGTKAYLEFSNEKGDRYQVGFDGSSGVFFSDRRTSGVTEFSDKFAKSVDTAPRHSRGSSIKMTVFVDRDSVELFADNGATVMTESVFPQTPYSVVRLIVDGHPVSVEKFNVTELGDIH
ncbi:MAG: glycoside hydrolase family 32 protein [Pseudoxanthomonas sp.]